MRKRVSANTARQHLGELLNSVYYQQDEVIIERQGRPMGVIIPVDRYEALQRSRQALSEAIDRLQAANAHIPTEEIEAEVAGAVQEVRAEAKRRASPR